MIHANFIGYHKCGYANCPVCKNAVTNSEYWPHIRSHPGHENDMSVQRSAFDGNRRNNADDAPKHYPKQGYST